jgi:hypothetical protein
MSGIGKRHGNSHSASPANVLLKDGGQSNSGGGTRFLRDGRASDSARDVLDEILAG